jgi:hypothetical protein
MNGNVSPYFRESSLAWPAAFWAALILLAGSVGCVWFGAGDVSAWKVVALPVAVALAALVASTAHLARVRAEWRYRAALEAFAAQQLERARRARPVA